MSQINIICLNTCIDRSLEIEDFCTGRVHKAKCLRSVPAGKGTNVARILAAKDIPARLRGFVGDDQEEAFAHLLADTCVAYNLTPLPGATRINTTILDPVNQTETHLREEGMSVSEEIFERFAGILVEETPANSWVVFCGSLAPGIDTDLFCRLLEQLINNGIQVGVDISGPALRAAVETGVHLIKPNRDELGEIIGTPLTDTNDILDTCHTLHEAQPHLCILASDGGNGAYLATKREIWHGILTHPVMVKNTVGAGDALLAGYLAGLSQGLTPRHCLLSAIQTASASLPCVCAGEIDPAHLYAEVSLEKL